MKPKEKKHAGGCPCLECRKYPGELEYSPTPPKVKVMEGKSVNTETDTKTLAEELRILAKCVHPNDYISQAADRLISQEKRIQELESLAETDYLHQAMEAQKQVAELESENAALKQEVATLKQTFSP